MNRRMRKVMNRRMNFISTIIVGGLIAVSANAEVVYNSIDNPLPPNVPSEGYQCCSTAELGNIVTPTFSGGTFTSASIVMSDWATKSTYPSGWGPVTTVDPAGFTVPLTLNIYSVGAGGAVGTEIGTVTENALIPWRPESGGCLDTTAYKGSDGGCYHGSASVVTFDLSSLNLSVPEQFIYGVAFNTNTWGYSPLGYDGPFESLNVGVENVGPSVGKDNGLGTYYVAGPVNGNVFSQNTNATNTNVADISGYGVEAQFSEAPEPSTFGLIGIGFLAVFLATRRSRLAQNVR